MAKVSTFITSEKDAEAPRVLVADYLCPEERNRWARLYCALTQWNRTNPHQWSVSKLAKTVECQRSALSGSLGPVPDNKQGSGSKLKEEFLQNIALRLQVDASWLIHGFDMERSCWPDWTTSYTEQPRQLLRALAMIEVVRWQMYPRADLVRWAPEQHRTRLLQMVEGSPQHTDAPPWGRSLAHLGLGLLQQFGVNLPKDWSKSWSKPYAAILGYVHTHRLRPHDYLLRYPDVVAFAWAELDRLGSAGASHNAAFTLGSDPSAARLIVPASVPPARGRGRSAQRRGKRSGGSRASP